jgi:cholesterol transport system auxiliary component
MNIIANYLYFTGARCRFYRKNSLLSRASGTLTACAAVLLAACSTPQPPTPKSVFDFGPSLSATASTASPTRTIALALPETEAGAGLDSPALLYRLQYADAQQLRPYAQARWSVPPAQLVRARLRDALLAHGAVLSGEGAAWVLRTELDEFSQLFDQPSSSQGIVRLRASLFQGNQLIAQTTVLARAAAPTQDAAGGVRALTAATDDAVRQLSAWAATHLKP